MSSPSQDVAELSLTEAVEQLRYTEQLLTTERAHRAALEIQVGLLAKERAKIFHLLRKCRYAILWRPHVIDEDLLKDLREFSHEQMTAELDKATQLYADYLATFVDPVIAQRERAEEQRKATDGKLLRLVAAVYLTAIVATFYSCAAT